MKGLAFNNLFYVRINGGTQAAIQEEQTGLERLDAVYITFLRYGT